LKEISQDEIELCHMERPTLYKRGEFVADERIINYDK